MFFSFNFETFLVVKIKKSFDQGKSSGVPDRRPGPNNHPGGKFAKIHERPERNCYTLYLLT